MKKLVLLLSSLVLAMLLASGVALLGVEEPAQAAFPGKNGKIAFTSERHGVGNGEIYIMNSDGTEQTRLTNTPEDDRWPTWSPNGTKIAFAREVDRFELYVMNADGSDQTRLTYNGVEDYYPAWSPDGSQILFTSFTDSGFAEVFVMNADGSGTPRNLTNNPAWDGTPAWSPDGTKIAFTSHRRGDAEIFIMNADGSNQSPLTNGVVAEHPEWSPDGAQIGFISYDQNQGGQIYTMSADGSTPPKHIAAGGYLAWSPDGTKITYSDSAHDNVFTANTDGSEVVQLTDALGRDWAPDWQPLPDSTGPKTKADCKNGGWKDFGFKNQDQCIKAVKNQTA